MPRSFEDDLATFDRKYEEPRRWIILVMSGPCICSSKPTWCVSTKHQKPSLRLGLWLFKNTPPPPPPPKQTYLSDLRSTGFVLWVWHFGPGVMIRCSGPGVGSLVFDELPCPATSRGLGEMRPDMRVPDTCYAAPLQI